MPGCARVSLYGTSTKVPFGVTAGVTGNENQRREFAGNFTPLLLLDARETRLPKSKRVPALLRVTSRYFALLRRREREKDGAVRLAC